MSYLWHLDGLSMALGIGELDGYTRSWNTKCHSIFFWTRIIRITRMFFGTRISQISRILCSWCLNTRFFLNTNFTLTRILFGTRLSFFKHTDLTDLTDFELLMFEHEFYSHGFWAFGSLWMTARCGCWLVVVIGLLWLLACCGYWLVMF